MKHVMIVPILILFCSTVFAQGDKAFGIKIGMTGNKKTCADCSQPILFPTFGVYGTLAINSNFSILSMLQYQRVGEQNRVEFAYNWGNPRRTTNLMYYDKITAPILLKYNVLKRPNFQLSSLLGITPNFLLHGRDLTKSYQDHGNGNGYSKSYDLNPFDKTYHYLTSSTRVIRRPQRTNVQGETGLMMTYKSHYSLSFTYQYGESIDYEIATTQEFGDYEQQKFVSNKQFILSFMYQLQPKKSVHHN